jgi:hypothetical protein
MCPELYLGCRGIGVLLNLRLKMYAKLECPETIRPNSFNSHSL